jgi:hypothetical protein
MSLTLSCLDYVEALLLYIFLLWGDGGGGGGGGTNSKYVATGIMFTASKSESTSKGINMSCHEVEKLKPQDKKSPDCRLTCAASAEWCCAASITSAN